MVLSHNCIGAVELGVRPSVYITAADSGFRGGEAQVRAWQGVGRSRPWEGAGGGTPLSGSGAQPQKPTLLC